MKLSWNDRALIAVVIVAVVLLAVVGFMWRRDVSRLERELTEARKLLLPHQTVGPARDVGAGGKDPVGASKGNQEESRF